MLITSKDNSRIKHIRKLLNKKDSFKEKLFIIEGENLIEEAIKSNLLKELYVLDGTKCDYSFNYDYVSLDVMKSISSLKSVPRLLGVCQYINKTDLGSKVVLLDNLQDPGNAGTIIRNAVAFGIDSVVFSKDSVSPYNEKVLRSTGGMIFNVNIIIDNIVSVINKLKNKNIKLIGTSLKNSSNLESLPKDENYALVFGNEGNGVSEEVISLCDKIVRIDMDSKCESLNVGVASGIVLYYMYKR